MTDKLESIYTATIKKDGTPRKRPTKYFVLKDEVKESLRVRMMEVIRYHGGPYRLAKKLRIGTQVVNEWVKRGKISSQGAQKIHNLYKREDCQGYRASFCRPDLEFTPNGKPLTLKCKKQHMLRMVKEEELALKPIVPRHKNRHKYEKETAQKDK